MNKVLETLRNLEVKIDSQDQVLKVIQQDVQHLKTRGSSKDDVSKILDNGIKKSDLDTYENVVANKIEESSETVRNVCGALSLSNTAVCEKMRDELLKENSDLAGKIADCDLQLKNLTEELSRLTCVTALSNTKLRRQTDGIKREFKKSTRNSKLKSNQIRKSILNLKTKFENHLKTANDKLSNDLNKCLKILNLFEIAQSYNFDFLIKDFKAQIGTSATFIR